ncbi:transmembrane protein [Methylobacterium sp. GXF4]|uniref:DUF3592 domain-containing protein n=1 Tax=Methylobacterium brachiatum TaxID=269660 RepID=A0ABV1R9X3_9HYPH|nr:hypothetical protein [Methylobacterium sp. GXF4]EIZ82099.1 transmembrane protein [Methylobacterium sp. GXF4]
MTASPNRSEPLRLPPQGNGWRGALRALIGFVALGGLLVACLVHTTPTLLTDWQVHARARAVPNAQVSAGTCKTTVIVHVCDVTVSLRTPTATVTRQVNYLFTGLHVGDYSIAVMADPERPDLVTTDLGLDQLWNRTITVLAIVLGLAGIIVAAGFAMIRNSRAASAAAAA